MIKCLKCGSDQITSKTIYDNENQSVIMVVCLNCGNEWNPADYNRLKQEAEQREKNRKYAAWKDLFYKAVEANDLSRAQQLLDQNRELKSKFSNPKDAYDYLKKKDKKSLYLIAVIIVIIIAFLLYFMTTGSITTSEVTN